MSSSVLDASALLAHLLDEPGKAVVTAAISARSAIGTINLAEVVTRLLQRGITEYDARTAIGMLRIDVIPFDEELAYRTALLRAQTRHLGLSLGDRACLALAEKLGLPVLTVDRAWASVSLGVAIQVIR